MKYNYLFGPVPSRRLGRSLGVDLVPHKTCTLDCVYCECGETINLTVTRKDYVPVQSVIAELDDYLSTAPALDYITFSGSGEPTLHSGIGEVVDFLKRHYPQYKLCLLTNGTLFNDPSVRSAVRQIDLIIPSLDAGSEKSFQAVNRPHADIKCEAIIDGLVKLRREYEGVIILEIFIVPGINDTPGELTLLKKAIDAIKPDRVQLGTLDRPGTEDWVEEADEAKMRDVAEYLGKAELIGQFRPQRNKVCPGNPYSDQILETLRRRPCTIADLQQITGLRPAEIQKHIRQLQERGKVTAVQKERGIFYKA